jgi:hypothetical protein
MNSREAPHVRDNLGSVDLHLELEERINSLSILVCDLLKTNQELRRALLDTTVDVQLDQES